MQVLVKNPFTPEIEPKGLVESFWSPNCLYPGHDFSFSVLLDLSNNVSLSPFLMLDPKVAFTVSQVNKAEAFCKNLGPLGTLGVHFFSGEKVIHEENQKEFLKYQEEYLPHNPASESLTYEQVVVFGENSIDEKLWNKLTPGGFYIIGTQGRITAGNFNVEPFGKPWPLGVATEIGWRFNASELGLEEFEFAKFRKLS
ncbi:MAG: hypothetical protein ACLGHN_07775 [Bacteriovoracia bacterium]